ncbi:hypothetical protein ACIQF6_33920 [Kitasatospora sp. NPDC092948]|uniref:hypothetical protein n=1 Tax=Kitasatospora sp. NPDC092948 TaxID=3364088 RepID=UPI00382DF07F
MIGDKRAARRHQEYLDERRRDRERELRTTLDRAAALTGMLLVMRPDTWHHLRRRPHLATLLAGLDATRFHGHPAGLDALMTVALSGPQLVHLAAVLHADMESDGTDPAERAARAIARRLYPVLAPAISAAHPGSPYLEPAPASTRKMPMVVLDSPDNA